MIRSSLCDYSDACILVNGTIVVPNMATAAAVVNNTNKKVAFKNCAPFTDCITEIDHTQVDDAQKIDIVIPMYNWIEYSDAYSKTSGNLWQCYRDDYSSDIDFQDFMNLYTKCTTKLYSFLVIDTTSGSDNSSRFRKNLLEII